MCSNGNRQTTSIANSVMAHSGRRLRKNASRQPQQTIGLTQTVHLPPMSIVNYVHPKPFILMEATTKREYCNRTWMELSVGTSHYVEVVIQLRRLDLDWWNADRSSLEQDLMKVISRKILPVESVFREEVLRRRSARRENENGQKAIVIGEQNLADSADAKKKRGTTKTGRRKKKSKNDDSNKKSSKLKRCTKDSAKRPTILFGEKIQIMYKLEDIQKVNSATLLYREEASGSEKKKSVSTAASSKKRKHRPLASFGQLKKLPKRIIIWCFKLDEEGDEEGSNSYGFPRPELVPLSSIFREIESDD